MDSEGAKFLATCGGFAKAVRVATNASRALWHLYLENKDRPPVLPNGKKRKRWHLRSVKYDDFLQEYCKVANDPSGRVQLDELITLMLWRRNCWKDGTTVNYRRSALNPLTLCRQLLEDARPDQDLRYFVWREVRKYYRFVQSAEIAHYMHSLSGALNALIIDRKETLFEVSSAPKPSISWRLHDEILPKINRRINQNFAMPLRMAEFFLECCRLVDYIQVSDTFGQVEIRASEIDAEFLMSQLFGLPTGIKGLDELFGGGGLMLVESNPDDSRLPIGGRAVLTVGPFGTGKSLLTLQIALEVARKGGLAWLMPMEQTAEECLYSLEAMGCLPDDTPIRIATSVPAATLLLETFDEEKGALILVRTIKDQFDDFVLAFEENESLMRRYPLRLIIVDPVSAVSQQSSDGNLRAKMLKLFETVKQAGTNIWLVSEENEPGALLVEQNIADTVIRVFQETIHGYSQRYIQITKSRLQREQRGKHAFSIGPGHGITVYPSSAAVRSRLLKRSVRTRDIPTAFGLPSVDKLIGEGNVFSGDVIVLQGPTDSGKTSLALAFALGEDLPQPDLSRPGLAHQDVAHQESPNTERREARAMLVTSLEREVSIRRQLQTIYEISKPFANFARHPNDILIVGLPGGYVKPGYILQRIEDEFERLRLQRYSIARVVMDNIANLELSCPFVSSDHTFGDTLVDLFRKHRVTSLFCCRDSMGEKGSGLQQSILSHADCLIRFHRIEFKGTTESHLEVRKTRGSHHRRGRFRLNLDTFEADTLSSLIRVDRDGKVFPVRIRLFLHAENNMQKSYNQVMQQGVRAVLSQDALLDDESAINFSGALGLGSASGIDELQVLQLDEFQIPSKTDDIKSLHKFSSQDWDPEWDDLIEGIRNRVDHDDGFVAVPFYENISVLAWRSGLDEACRSSWESLAEKCHEWEIAHPDKDELFFDFSGMTGENFNCLFFEILLSLAPQATNLSGSTIPSCHLWKWLSSDAASQASILFYRLCRRAYASRKENFQKVSPGQVPFYTNTRAQVWRHWYSSLNQMLAEMSLEERAAIHVGPLPKNKTTAGEWYLSIPSYSAAPDVGLHLIKLFTNNEAELDRLKYGVGLPTREAFYNPTAVEEAEEGAPGSDFASLFPTDTGLLHALITSAFRRSSFACYRSVTNLISIYLQDILEQSDNDARELERKVSVRLNDLRKRLRAASGNSCESCSVAKVLT